MTSRGPQDETERIRARLAELEAESRRLDPDAAERSALLDAVDALAQRYFESLPTSPAFTDTPGRGAGLLDLPFGEDGAARDDVLQRLERDVLAPGAHTASPAHLAYIPGGALYHAALGDYIAAVSNKYSGLFFTGPGPVRMENMVIRWVADLIGYPANAGGNIASGGSLATLAAIVAARDAHALRGADYAAACVYISAQTHHAVEKALRIAGMAEAQVRAIRTDELHRMRPDSLEDAIRSDRAHGLRPWLIVATAGSTDTGAVDPLAAIADIAARERCWLHVDAAYGGFFLLTAHGRRLMAGIDRADSVVLDPHKSMFMPWGSGIVVVRDVERLALPHHGHGAYLADVIAEPGEVSPADVSAELTRPFRALRMWLPLQLLGVRPFRAALEEKLLLAQYFHREIERAGFETGPAPQLSVVTYRSAPAGADAEQTDAINRAIAEESRRDGRVFVSSTVLEGRVMLRMAALQFRTHRDTIDLAVNVLRDAAHRVLHG
jgi:aromatic-L-amino-acid decarboxylase